MGHSAFKQMVLAAAGVVALACAGPASAVEQAAGEAAVSAAPAVQKGERPRLIVAISVDQFSANLFGGWRGRYTGGLKRLGNEGITYANGYQTHGGTETCPGHSTLLTGHHPRTTGIVGNDYFDPALGREVYCLEDTDMRPAHDPKADPTEGRSPKKLRVSTLGDWLKAQSPKSRVFAVSGKDRGAINMGGHKADGEFWLAPGHGFTTFVPAGQSGEKALAPMAALNKRIQEYWKNTPPVWTYAEPSCKALERDWVINGTPWRSQLPPVAWDVKSPTFVKDQFMWSPFMDELTLDGARELIRTFKLGQGEAPDLLAISLSGNDYVGHRYGTQGPEMCDQQARLDRQLGRFLSDLEQLGVPFLVVLSADHGGIDVPERLHTQGLPEVGRVDPIAFAADLNSALRTQLGLDFDPIFPSGIDQLWVVDRNGRTPSAEFRQTVLQAATTLLRQRPEVVAVFDRETLVNTPVEASKMPDELTLQERLALSAVPDRIADLTVTFKPYLQIKAPKVDYYISGHGTAWSYDRRVPILFWWPGVTPEERPLPIRTVDIAPTLAHVLGIQPDGELDGRCLDLGDFGTGPCPAVAKP